MSVGCPECGKKFRKREHLTQHIEAKHPWSADPIRAPYDVVVACGSHVPEWIRGMTP
jgi:hypothetical protein